MTKILFQISANGNLKTADGSTCSVIISILMTFLSSEKSINMDSFFQMCPSLTLPSSANVEDCSVDSQMLQYLFDVIEKANDETSEVFYSKNKDRLSLDKFLVNLKQASYKHIILVLCGYFTRPRLPGLRSLLLSHLLSSPASCEALETICELAAVNSQETVRAVFEPVLFDLRQRMLQLSVDDVTSVALLEVLKRMTAIKCKNAYPICDLMVNLSNWNPIPFLGNEGMELQMTSYLGPFLSLSIHVEDDPRIVEKYFQSADVESDKVKVTADVLQASTSQLRRLLFNVVENCLRYGRTRETTLAYIAQILASNVKRSQIFSETERMSTNGFMMNVTSIMQMLLKPVDISKVDPLYPFHPSTKLVLSADTARLKATSKEVKSWISTINNFQHQPKFSTECFFMTFQFYHISFVPLIHNFKEFVKLHKEFERFVAKLESLQYKADNKELNNAKLRAENIRMGLAAKKMALFDPEFISGVCFAYSLMSRFLLQLLTNDGSQIFSTAVPMNFAALPEFFIDDFAEIFLFILQHAPTLISEQIVDDIATLIIDAIYNYNMITNRNVVDKLVDIMHLVSRTAHSHTKNFNEAIFKHQLASERLVPGLLKYYCDVESTNGSYFTRLRISTIFKFLWKNSFVQKKFVDEAGGPAFVKFVNVLMSDTTYLLDEGLKVLRMIREIQDLVNDSKLSTVSLEPLLI